LQTTQDLSIGQIAREFGYSEAASLVLASLTFLGLRTSQRFRYDRPDDFQIAEVVIGDTLANVRVLSVDPVDGTNEGSVTVTLGDVIRQAHAPCVALVFFSPTCTFCQDLAAAWAKSSQLTNEVGHWPIRWVGVAAAGRERNRRFLVDYRLPRPAYELEDLSSLGELGVGGYPSLYLVDRDLRLRAILEQSHSKASVTAAEACPGNRDHEYGEHR